MVTRTRTRERDPVKRKEENNVVSSADTFDVDHLQEYRE